MTVKAHETAKAEEAWRGGEQRTVAYVDILGFSEETKELKEHPEGFPRMVEALLGGSMVEDSSGDQNDLLNILAGQGGDEKYKVDLQFAFFSDCTFVSARDVAGGTDKVLSVVLGYARNLLNRGFFVRGGIARGLAAHRAGMVVGPAVLAAYGIEQKAAVFPRIVVEDVIACELLKLANKPNMTATIRQGEDGLYFVDILSTLGLRGGGEEDLRRARELIVGHLEKGHSLDIKAKWRWLAAQYNRAVSLVVRTRKVELAPIKRLDVIQLPESP